MTQPASFGTVHPLDWTPIKPQPVIHTLFSELDPTPFVGPATALKVALRSNKNVQLEGIYIYIYIKNLSLSLSRSLYIKESRKSQHRGQSCSERLLPSTLFFSVDFC